MPDDFNSTDPDGSLSSSDVGEEAVFDEISTGDEGEVGQTTETGVELVPGYDPPESASRFASVSEEALYLDTQFPDVGEASFGPPEPIRESVIGTDDRVRISPANTYPWRVHCSLQITAADDSMWIGTGWLVGPRLVVTAGHCIYIRSNIPARNGWVKRVVVMPGRDGTSLPFGSTVSTNFRTVNAWANSGNHEYDYGAILLNTPIGNATGWLGYGNWSNLDGVVGNISGYPGDKPAGTQWYHSRPITSATDRKVHYTIDTAGGQSGSAVYRVLNGNRYGFAIHAYGGATSNSGTRINSAVLNNINTWRQQSGS